MTVRERESKGLAKQGQPTIRREEVLGEKREGAIYRGKRRTRCCHVEEAAMIGKGKDGNVDAVEKSVCGWGGGGCSCCNWAWIWRELRLCHHSSVQTSHVRAWSVRATWWIILFYVWGEVRFGGRWDWIF